MIELVNVKKTYASGQSSIKALDGVSIRIDPGKLIFILGPSGSGKSTLLNLLGGMDRASSGEVLVEGHGNLAGKSDSEMTAYRRSSVGFVFQFYNLIPNLTALENVGLAAQLADSRRKAAVTASAMIDAVGLGDRRNSFPQQLSGGEMQRVAIARALAKHPTILLCDEPTGALDSETGRSIMSLLQTTAQKNPGTAVIVVTHNPNVAPSADQLIRLRDGRVVEVACNSHALPIAEVI